MEGTLRLLKESTRCETSSQRIEGSIRKRKEEGWSVNDGIDFEMNRESIEDGTREVESSVEEVDGNENHAQDELICISARRNVQNDRIEKYSQ